MNYDFPHQIIGNLTKPWILFLHGFMGDRNEFNQVIDFLKTDFCCLTIDLPGHGNNQIRELQATESNEIGKYKFYRMPEVAAGIIDFLDQFINSNHNFHQDAHQKISLVGYSMGGRLGLYLALHYPHRFSQVVLESASPGLAQESERRSRVQSDLGIARKLTRIGENKPDFEIFLRNWYQQSIFGEIQHHHNYEKMLAQRLQNNSQELAKSLECMGTGVQPSLWVNSLWDNLINLKLPLLLLVGEKDTKFVEINQKINHIYPKSQLKIIPNSGHNIHFENPQLFAQIIREFLDSSSKSQHLK